MRALKYVIFLLFLACSAAFADEAGKAAKVEELFRVSKLEDTFRQAMSLTMNQVKSGILQQITGVKLPPDKQRDVDAFTNKVTQVVTEGLSWEKLKPAYVKIYADQYSDDELDGIIAFYKSPAGQA